MTKLTKSLNSWASDKFKSTLKQEIEALGNKELPLNQATTQGGLADDSDISVLVNSITDNKDHIQVKIGIFFNEIIAGCNCGDDPAAENTYCEIQLSIDKKTADSCFILQQ